MIVALHSRLEPGSEEGYDRGHARIPDDLRETFARPGVRDWRTWRSGLDVLHLVDCDDDAALPGLEGDPADERWQLVIDGCVDHFADQGRGTAGPQPLRPVRSLVDPSVPASLLEAARLDGCSEVQVLWKIALALATPVVALVGFSCFVQKRNNDVSPFVMLPSSHPVQVGLSTLLSSTPAFNPSAAGSQSVHLSALALVTVVSVLPVLVVLLFSQRFLVEGMTAGRTKE